MTTCALKPSPAPSPEAIDMLATLRADGVVSALDATLTPLTGGVSSEIYLVTDGPRRFIVKRALAQLKVKDTWFADTRRNAHELAYLRYVGAFLPDAVPRILHSPSPVAGAEVPGERDVTSTAATPCASRVDIPSPQPSPPASGEREQRPDYFAMEYLGEGFANWKTELLAGRIDERYATQAMRILATIHERSSGDAQVAATFATNEDFEQLRIDPYLRMTGTRHPQLQHHFINEATRLAATREALVHGDFSPKNMLISGNRLVVLDCEVAWYGDPTFDVAFLLNHLLLKSLYHAPRDVGLQRVVEAAWQTYRAARRANAEEIEQRACRLLPMLLLARVDGKSPVDYLDEEKRERLRAFAYRFVPTPPHDLSMLFRDWFASFVPSHSTLSEIV